MTNRWWIAVAGAIGLGMAAIPLMTGGGVGETASALTDDKVQSATAAGICSTKTKPARYDFVLKDMHGQNVDLAAYKGKVVMLNFWATWCGPCKVEIPMFVELQQRYRDQGLVFLGVSIDDPPEALRAFAQEYSMNYPILQGLGRDDIQSAYGPMFGIPVTLLIARDGTICTRYLGPRPKERFERDIKALL